ncbi:MAG: PIG-L family deacetylase [Sphingobium sp.]
MVAVGLAQQPWRRMRWLVLAPHPDDETLGAGSLIAQTAREGRLAALAYVTDGSGSHEPDDARPGRIGRVRKREATLALRRLAGIRSAPPLFLGWKDAAPVRAGQPAFERTRRSLAALCVRLRVNALAVTAHHEPHCDHEAAAELAYAVQASARRAIVVMEYVVWGKAPPARTYRRFVTCPMLPGQRRHALAAHRSQLSAAFGPGFRLAKQQRRMAARDILYLRRSS